MQPFIKRTHSRDMPGDHDGFVVANYSRNEGRCLRPCYPLQVLDRKRHRYFISVQMRNYLRHCSCGLFAAITNALKKADSLKQWDGTMAESVQAQQLIKDRMICKVYILTSAACFFLTDFRNDSAVEMTVFSLRASFHISSKCKVYCLIILGSRVIKQCPPIVFTMLLSSAVARLSKFTPAF
jgi:hypothetical protein